VDGSGKVVPLPSVISYASLLRGLVGISRYSHPKIPKLSVSDKEARDFALTDDLGSFCNNLSKLTRSISEIVSQRHGEHASCHACVNPTPSASSIQHRTLLRSSLNGSTRQQCHVALNMITDCPCFLEVPTPPPQTLRIIAATISTAVQMIFCVP